MYNNIIFKKVFKKILIYEMYNKKKKNVKNNEFRFFK